MLFLARWARRLSWKETVDAFRTSWERFSMRSSMSSPGGWSTGRWARSTPSALTKSQYAKGHKYLTLVYQIDIGITRLLWVGKERTIESFQVFAIRSVSPLPLYAYSQSQC